MYFQFVDLKKKKPNSGWFRGRVALVNKKTKEIHTMKPGFVTDWEYFIDKGFTHWLQPVSKVKLKQSLCIQ